MASISKKEAQGHESNMIPVSIAAMLVTLGVVYGDIGTSPMYVTKALVAGKAASSPCTAWSAATAHG